MHMILQQYYNRYLKTPTIYYKPTQQGLIILFIFIHGIILGQIVPSGVPPIKNFPKNTYNAAPQNWNIDQLPNQTMLFANNMGLLLYNGNYWSRHEIGNRTIVRSVKYLDDGKIVVGGQGDIGYFTFDQNGGASYHTITDLIPERHKLFEDIWHIVAVSDTICFNSSRRAFIWINDTVKVYEFDQKIEHITNVDQAILIYVDKEGLYKVHKSQVVKIAEALNIQSPVSGLIATSDSSYLVSTERDGIFILKNGRYSSYNSLKLRSVSQNWINKMIKLHNEKIVLGTAQNGIYILDTETDHAININTTHGLQNNNIIALHQDKEGNLWVSTENGLDLIQYHSPYRLIYPDGTLRGAGYTAAKHKNELYFGTTNGLYRYERSSLIDEFSYVSNTKGQVWNLDTLDDKLFMGHHSGGYIIDGLNSYSIFEESGVWTFFSYQQESYLLGSYDGIGYYNQHSGSSQLLRGFAESSRIIIKDSLQQIWLSHPYRGIFKIEIDIDANTSKALKVDEDLGYNESFNAYIYLINNTPYISDESGIYKYDYESDSFSSDTLLQSTIGANTRVKHLYQDNQDNIWYHVGDDIGVLMVRDLGLKKDISKKILPQPPEKLIGGFPFIMHLEGDQFLFGCEQGFVTIDMTQGNEPFDYLTLINAVIIPGDKDSIVYKGHYTLHNAEASPLHFSTIHKSLRFSFSSTSFGDALKEYRYRIIGLSDQYSDWSTNSEVQISNLNHGSYKLEVESRIAGIIQEDKAILSFIMPTPWYRTSHMRAFIIAILALLVFLFFLYQKKKFESEKKALHVIHQKKVEEKNLQVEKTEEELTRLKNEKLKAEIDHKNKELASSTMHLVQKQELLSGVQHSLEKVIQNNQFSDIQQKDLNNIIQMLKQDAIIDNDWDRFSQYFDEVHGNFTQKLRDQYPKLTNYDIKLSAYLRMNLTTKEIASLMNVSARAIEGSRYRLRKKLDLSSGVNLVEFMQSF